MTLAGEQCARVWEVEAAHDGRLAAEDTASLDRHVHACADCATTRASLAELRAVAHTVPRATLPPLAARRLRHAVLREAARPGAPEGRVSPRALAAVGVAVAVLACAGVTAILRGRTGPRADAGAAIVVMEPVAAVTAEGAALWSREIFPTREAVTLAAGSLDVRVRAPRGGRRVVLRVPDGEVEVGGSHVRVTVEGGHLRRVDMVEGVVAVRVAGAAETIVAPGGLWQTTSVALTPTAAPDAVPGDDGTEVPTVRTGAGGGPRGTGTTVGRFARGVSALDHGHPLAAARAFGAFVHDHGDDPRAEDAAFLQAVALRRAGRMDEAVAAARRYLARYPAGLRRREAEVLLMDAVRGVGVRASVQGGPRGASPRATRPP